LDCVLLSQPAGYAWVVNRWCKAAQALGGRGGAGRLVAGSLVLLAACRR